ncbi:MAG: 50S ribosomal protein L25/general stress protein Ctc [Propionibacteriaceae bacterium]|nr:50S ribosomal protein L25/general stress protein Ctc [Propionibacteriaceae bacterium]
MAENTIAGVSRTEFGKGAARRTRRAGLVPAVLYGHGTDPVHLSLPGHEVLLALRVANAVLELSIDEGESQLALAKQVQRNPVKGTIEHLDLVIVRKGEKVTVEVPMMVVGDHPADRIVSVDKQTVALEVEATAIPAGIEVNVAGLEIGDNVTAKDLVLPEGAVYAGDADDLILTIAPAPTQVIETEEGAAGEALEAEAEAGEAEAAEEA